MELYTETASPYGGIDRGWPATSGVLRWVLLADTQFLASPGSSAQSLGTLPQGTEVDCLALEKAEGQKWCKIRIASGQTGYLIGTALIRKLVYASLEQSQGEMRTAPDPYAPVLRNLKKKDEFLLVTVVGTKPNEWVKIRCSDGQEGYLLGTVKIKRIEPGEIKGAGDPGRDMLVGGLWCVGGIVVTAVTYSAASEGGGHYVIAWGAIVFGGIQFLKGLFNIGKQ